MKSRSEWIKLLTVSFFGTGFIPFMPGTFGSIAALSVLAVPEQYFAYVVSHLIFIYGFASMLVLNGIESRYGHDPSFVVADEVLAIWLILLFPACRINEASIISSVLLFRLFDIWKPLFLKKLNARSGAFYVVADDLAAAAFTVAAIYLLTFFKALNI